MRRQSLLWKWLMYKPQRHPYSQPLPHLLLPSQDAQSATSSSATLVEEPAYARMSSCVETAASNFDVEDDEDEEAATLDEDDDMPSCCDVNILSYAEGNMDSWTMDMVAHESTNVALQIGGENTLT